MALSAAFSKCSSAVPLKAPLGRSLRPDLRACQLVNPEQEGAAEGSPPLLPAGQGWCLLTRRRPRVRPVPSGHAVFRETSRHPQPEPAPWSPSLFLLKINFCFLF